jgi:uncharacterized protein YggE
VENTIGGKVMKKIWLAIAGVALIVVLAGMVGCSSGEGVTLNADTSSLKLSLSGQQEGIWVNGEGIATAVPDTAILTLGIEAQELTVAEARDQAAEAMTRVMDTLKSAGIDEADIQTQYFNIQEVTRWDSDKQQQTVIGYQVTNTVTVKVRDVTKTSAVIDSVTAAGGDLTRINSLAFTVDDPSSYYEQARTDAVADAAAKAKQLADLADVKLGKPTYISESSYIPGPIYRDVATVGEGVPAATPTTPVSPGEMEITVNVQIGYAITD